jgi:rSAM/selenodomain-associated transferase 2
MAAPDFSIVVPVLYEEDTIAGLLERLRRIEAYECCEVIVVDGDPLRGTIRSVTDERVVTLTSPPWRSRQMNAGAAVARGRVLVFLHADTFLPWGALNEIEEAVRDGRFEGGAFRLEFDSDRTIYRFMSRFVTLRSKWNRLPYGDQAIFVTKRLFERLGGYSEIPIMEDVEFVRRARRSGARMKILDSTVQTSCRRMEAEGVVKRALQNWMMIILYTLGVKPEKLVRFYSEDYRLKKAGERRSAVECREDRK